MEAAASRSGRGFDEDDDDDQEFGKRDGSSFHRGGSFSLRFLASFSRFSDLSSPGRPLSAAPYLACLNCAGTLYLTARVDGKGSGTDELPATPRSKHSAMEQRRRNKINDRQVIEYIRFLQEKDQKSESSYPGWNQDNAKLMPWVKVYYRSFWKNAQNNNQIPVDGLSDPSPVIRNGSAPPASAFSGQFDESNIPVAPVMLSNAQNPTESDATAALSYKIMETATGFANSMPSQAQSHWLGASSPADCAVNNEILNEHEELVIDEGTINASATYSQGLLTTLTQSLQSSGVDLSQASISVQINLGKRATNKRAGATSALSNSKDPDDDAAPTTNQAVGHSTMGNISEESSQARKRHKADN
ncbi:Transcription factor BIM2 [Musa troglodytarum]|uniref:Transcription factor BIM2 n=1 Tax=Musa troglodytarum TaxID=320322 RepID=A0A9E7GFY8_9LILI|nr:Transcription factor BIM2 [Musa troglodytarum]